MNGWILYLVGINLLGLVLMGVDKRRAQQHQWRIPEKALFAVALVGGSVGCLAGMFLFRHKTRKWYFLLGMPAILAIQLILLVCVRLHLLDWLDWALFY